MRFFLFVITLCFIPMQVHAVLHVVYPDVNGIGRDSFGYAALKLALEHSGVEYELKISKQKVNNARIRLLIEQNKISVSDFGTSPEFEDQLQAIYFPIDLGLNGWRIFLIHHESLATFEHIKSLIELQQYTAGQGVGWSDVEILEQAKLKVMQTAKIEGLFKMVNRQRFDYFPLGANEAHSLLSEYQSIAPKVVVEPSLLLVYPFARLFFVNKDNKELHDAIKIGLIRAYEDGSFMALFKSHQSNRAFFSKAHLEKRKRITIDNPFMTDNFRKIPKKYFYTLP